MFKIFLILLAFPAQALPRSEPNVCGDGVASVPDTLHPTVPHCTPALSQSKRLLPNG